MELNEYQKQVLTTRIYPIQVAKDYVTLNLAAEAGEVAGVYAKCLRDDGGLVHPDKKEKILKELGDVAWQLAACAYEFGFSLEEVCQQNLLKLKNRKEKGTLSGSGDDR